MHAYCEKEKLVEILTLGLNHAQIYVNVSMDLSLQKELLVAQCKPNMRKQYSHPNGISKEGTKIWLSKWVIWHIVEASSVSVLCSVMEKLYPDLKKKEPRGESKAILEAYVKSFKDYASNV